MAPVRNGRWPRATWFCGSEWIAAWSSQRLVADHPAGRQPPGDPSQVAQAPCASPSRTAPIPFGAPMSLELVPPLGLAPDRYLVSVGRIRSRTTTSRRMVEAFSRRCRRGAKLGGARHAGAVGNPYHGEVDRAAASARGAVPRRHLRARRQVKALRVHARAYLHGHTVGGTNPSLVEALWPATPSSPTTTPSTAGRRASGFFFRATSPSATIDRQFRPTTPRSNGQAPGDPPGALPASAWATTSQGLRDRSFQR